MLFGKTDTMWKLLKIVLLAAIVTCTLASADGEAEKVEEGQQVDSETVDVELPDQQVEEKVDKEKRNREAGYCVMGGVVYQHGQIFSGHNPCSKYRCEDGHPNLVEEGCYLGETGRCFPVNSVGEYECQKFRCTKTTSGNSYYYNFTPIDSPGCKDYYGRCRVPGERFPYAINGRLYGNCECIRARNRQVQYRCRSE